MPNSASSFVDYKAVKAAVSIVQILEHYDLLKSLRHVGDSLTGTCPLHNGENPTQFRVSISKNCWNCFGKCKRGGNVIDFVSLMENVRFREAALKIQGWFHLEAKGSTKTKPASEKPPTPDPNAVPKLAAEKAMESPAPSRAEQEDVTENPPLGFSLNHLNRAHPYFTERGLTPETVQAFDLGFCGKGVMADRIAIPIHNSKGELVAYAGRFPGQPPEGKGKYRLPKNFKKSLEIFNFHRAAALEPIGPLVLVEGFFDCIKIWQAGHRRVVSIMGSSLSESQAVLLIKLARPDGRILILFDEDDAGREGRAKALTRLAAQTYVKAIPCGPEGSQPDQLPVEQLTALLK